MSVKKISLFGTSLMVIIASMQWAARVKFLLIVDNGRWLKAQQFTILVFSIDGNLVLSIKFLIKSMHCNNDDDKRGVTSRK
jgi:hypothetical protein